MVLPGLVHITLYMIYTHGQHLVNKPRKTLTGTLHICFHSSNIEWESVKHFRVIFLPILLWNSPKELIGKKLIQNTRHAKMSRHKWPAVSSHKACPRLSPVCFQKDVLWRSVLCPSVCVRFNSCSCSKSLLGDSEEERNITKEGNTN